MLSINLNKNLITPSSCGTLLESEDSFSKNVYVGGFLHKKDKFVERAVKQHLIATYSSCHGMGSLALVDLIKDGVVSLLL